MEGIFWNNRVTWPKNLQMVFCKNLLIETRSKPLLQTYDKQPLFPPRAGSNSKSTLLIIFPILNTRPPMQSLCLEIAKGGSLFLQAPAWIAAFACWGSLGGSLGGSWRSSWRGWRREACGAWPSPPSKNRVAEERLFCPNPDQFLPWNLHPDTQAHLRNWELVQGQ